MDAAILEKLETPRLVELRDLLAQVDESERYGKLLNFRPYPWQLEFYDAGGRHNQRMLCAGNRVGKTLGAAVEVALHALGEYPDWWPERAIRFNHAPLIWALGVSGEQIRDVIQKILFGDLIGDEFDGTGIIPAERIIGRTPTPGVPRLAKDVHISHVSGRHSIISLKSYTQGQGPLMGSEVDLAWIDEQPADEEIYPQVVTRTVTGNRHRGGYVMLTMTPELGFTELVRQFFEDRKDGQYLQVVTWDDAPHLTDDVKTKMLAAVPEYQRDMRSKGMPLLGSGLVFPVAEEALKVQPFPIPDHYARITGIDFGIAHPFACVHLAYNRDTDVIYVVDSWRMSDATPPTHAARIRGYGDWVPVAYPHDADNREKGSGETLKEQYRRAGLDLDIPFANPDGSRFVEPGIVELLDRMRTGRFKVFADQDVWFSEFRRYHRDNGKIVKLDDDLMDATRYGAITAPRFARSQREMEVSLAPAANQVWDY